MSDVDFQWLAVELYPAVLDAGHVEMQHFNSDLIIETKADRSPVTAADREAEEIIVAALKRIFPDQPVVAEEAVAAGDIPAVARQYFLVDALDGTRLFVRKKPEFSVNIGLVSDGFPIFGLIYVPPSGALYLTRGAQCSVWAEAPCSPDERIPFEKLSFTRLQTRTPDRAHLKAFNSRSAGAAGQALLEALAVKDAMPIGSSLKFCLIAAGEGDLYARLGETSEWDTAAGQAILEAAGGSVTTLDGRRLSYGKGDKAYRNPHFVAWGRAPLITNFQG
jgi:3'(2'), 5'-bisphosphate nucleotidase